jgi:hypothetical protein
MNTLANTEMRELSAEEIDAAAGAAAFFLDLGLIKLSMSQTDAGTSVNWQSPGGKWQGTTVWHDELPK